MIIILTILDILNAEYRISNREKEYRIQNNMIRRWKKFDLSLEWLSERMQW